MLKRFKKISKSIAISVFSVSTVLFLAISAPQIHNSYLRYEVGQSVVEVLVPGQFGGGTGFAVRSASGKDFIATNRHVCESAINGWMEIKSDSNDEKILKRVVYKDNKADLCLLEGDSRFSPLKLAFTPEKGDIHYIVGHPGLRQLTISSGEYIGNAEVQLQQEVEKREQCTGKVYELDILQQLLTGQAFVCVRTFKAYGTTAVAYPGNSGSPVVNKYGNVIGVLFAGSNSEERDNFLVPGYELERVLNKF